jgi:hypothetical protein
MALSEADLKRWERKRLTDDTNFYHQLIQVPEPRRLFSGQLYEQFRLITVRRPDNGLGGQDAVRKTSEDVEQAPG